MSNATQTRKSKAPTDYEIELTLTPFEASVIQAVLMQSVHWAGSGKFGAAAKTIYATLSDEGDVEEALWTPTKEDGRNWMEI